MTKLKLAKERVVNSEVQNDLRGLADEDIIRKSFWRAIVSFSPANTFDDISMIATNLNLISEEQDHHLIVTVKNSNAESYKKDVLVLFHFICHLPDSVVKEESINLTIFSGVHHELFKMARGHQAATVHHRQQKGVTLDIRCRNILNQAGISLHASTDDQWTQLSNEDLKIVYTSIMRTQKFEKQRAS